MNKEVKEHMVLRGKARAEDLARDEDTSSGSDNVYEITQSETEGPTDIHMPAVSPLGFPAFAVEDMPKPVSFLFLGSRES